MDNQALITLLKDLNACSEAIEWVEEEKLTLKQAWFKCERANWLIWFAAKTNMASHQELVLVACACAKTVLKYVPEGEKRPQQAIEAAKRWALNPTEENKKAASSASSAAYSAAYSAADAAAAAYAAYSASTTAQKQLCNIIRKMIKFKEIP